MSMPAGDKVNEANALPIRLVISATFLALALIASMGWYVWNSVQVLHEVQVRTFHLLALTGEIADLNESVWASARLRLATKEPRWLERYRTTLARRNAALEEFRSLAPDLYDSPFAVELREANDRLAAIEASAFELAERGESAKAPAQELGDEYDRQKQISADATAGIARYLSASADGALDIQRRRGRTVVTTVAIAVMLLLFTWITSLRISARQNAQRLREAAGRAENDRLAAFVDDVRESLTKADSLARILQSCANAMVQRLDPALARIWILDQRDNTLVLSASAGLYTNLEEPHGRVPVGSKYKIGLIASDRRAHLTNDVPNDPNVGDPEWAREQGITAFAGYPLIVEDRVVGVMAMFSRASMPAATVKAPGFGG